MKKLTAGIFATILGLTTVDAFAASVASTNYVKGAITETLNDAKAYTDEKVAGIEIPTIDHLATKTELQAVDTAYKLADTTLQANIDKKLDSTTAATTYETIENAKAYAKKAELAAVATSGSYTDLQNKPTIPSIEGLATSDEVAQALADAKAYADTNDANTVYDDTALAGRVSANETAISSLQSADTALGTRVTANADAITAMDTAYKAADTALGTRVTTAEGAIETLTTGHEYQANQIALNETAIKDIKTEQTTQNADIAALKSGKADASELSKYVLLTDVVDTYTK